MCATLFSNTPKGILFGQTLVVNEGPEGKLSRSYQNPYARDAAAALSLEDILRVGDPEGGRYLVGVQE